MELVKPQDTVDITPNHNPVKLAQTMVEKAPGAVAGFFILLDEDGGLYRDMNGMSERDILWALEKCKNELLNGEWPPEEQ